MAEREVCIVTGASRGIGKRIALKFAEEGKDVMLFGRDIEALKQTQKLVKKEDPLRNIMQAMLVTNHSYINLLKKLLISTGRLIS